MFRLCALPSDISFIQIATLLSSTVPASSGMLSSILTRLANFCA
jgi:hypothetical protein